MNGVWDEGLEHVFPVRDDESNVGFLRVTGLLREVGGEWEVRVVMRAREGDGFGLNGHRFPDGLLPSSEEARDAAVAWVQGQLLRGELFQTTPREE